jgi:hypothetical protein
MQPKYFRIGDKVQYVDEIGNMRLATEEEIQNNTIIEFKTTYGVMPVIRDIFKYEKRQNERNRLRNGVSEYRNA